MENDEFTTFGIMNILKLKRGRLREWMKYGFIKPSIQLADGPSIKALFNRTDIYTLVLFRNLIESGLGRFQAANCAHSMYLEEAGSAKYLIYRIYVDRNLDVVNSRTGKTDREKRDVVAPVVSFANTLKDVTHVGAHMIVVDLEKIREDVDKAIGG